MMIKMLFNAVCTMFNLHWTSICRGALRPKQSLFA